MFLKVHRKYNKKHIMKNDRRQFSLKLIITTILIYITLEIFINMVLEKIFENICVTKIKL